MPQSRREGHVSFLWPEALWLLLLAPVLVLVYRWLLRRRQAQAIAAHWRARLSPVAVSRSLLETLSV